MSNNAFQALKAEVMRTRSEKSVNNSGVEKNFSHFSVFVMKRFCFLIFIFTSPDGKTKFFT